MKTHFESSFFVGNREKLKSAHKGSFPIVIAGNGLLQRTADNTVAFAQDSNFWYLTGLVIPNAVLIIDETDEYLIVPTRTAVQAAFDGAIDAGQIAARSGLQTVLGEKEGWGRVKDRLQVTKQATYLQPNATYETRHGMFANPMRRRIANRLNRMQTGLHLIDARRSLAKLRSVKQPCELAAIEQAVAITKATFEALTSYAVTTENALEAAISYEFRTRGADGHAYNPIVASGKNATTLHYDKNSDKIGQNDIIVVDVGAEVEHYAADITRSLCFGAPSERQKAVLAAVKRVQEKTLQLFKPGADMRTIEHQVEEYIGAELVSLGLIESETDTEAVRRYYPHSVSHFLGLDVHDVGDYREPLAEHMVLTCEPGIYIQEEGIGVRIEDDIVITGGGCRVL